MPNLTFVKQKQKQSLLLTSNFSDIDKIASGMQILSYKMSLYYPKM